RIYPNLICTLWSAVVSSRDGRALGGASMWKLILVGIAAIQLRLLNNLVAMLPLTARVIGARAPRTLLHSRMRASSQSERDQAINRRCRCGGRGTAAPRNFCSHPYPQPRAVARSGH